MRFPFLSVLSVLALAACADGATAPTEPTGPAFAANPESSGAMIVRWTSTPVFVLWDAENELMVAHTFRDPYGACAPPGTPFELYLGEMKQVISQRDPAADLVRELLKTPEIAIKVWHSASPDWTIALRCSPPIATGVGHSLYTDNSVNAWRDTDDRNAANAFGWRAQGTLEGPGGEQYHYNGVYYMKWQPNSADPADRVLEFTKINLVPTGN